jgi:hypothetical protein
MTPIIQLHANIAAKIVLLLPIAVVSTMAVHYVVVRPTPILRAVLGMRARHPASATTAGAQAV